LFGGFFGFGAEEGFGFEFAGAREDGRIFLSFRFG
jgi:hypothetical protein